MAGTPHTHRLRVRWAECDMQGVVFFAKYAEYVDIALTEVLRTQGRSYERLIASGVDFMVAEMNLRYRASARFDEEIDVVLAVESFGETSMVLGWRIVRDDTLLCEGTIRHVFVDTAEYRKTRVPDDIRAMLG